MDLIIVAVGVSIIVAITTTILLRGVFPAPPVAIEVRPVTGGHRMGEWIARVRHQPGTWEIANTQVEAIGKLMVSLDAQGKVVEITYVSA